MRSGPPAPHLARLPAATRRPLAACAADPRSRVLSDQFLREGPLRLISHVNGFMGLITPFIGPINSCLDLINSCLILIHARLGLMNAFIGLINPLLGVVNP